MLLCMANGLTSLQFRKQWWWRTEEKNQHLHLLMFPTGRRGKSYTMSVARKGELFKRRSKHIDLGDDVFVGLFICSPMPCYRKGNI